MHSDLCHKFLSYNDSSVARVSNVPSSGYELSQIILDKLIKTNIDGPLLQYNQHRIQSANIWFQTITNGWGNQFRKLLNTKWLKNCSFHLNSYMHWKPWSLRLEKKFKWMILRALSTFPFLKTARGLLEGIAKSIFEVCHWSWEIIHIIHLRCTWTGQVSGHFSEPSIYFEGFMV